MLNKLNQIKTGLSTTWAHPLYSLCNPSPVTPSVRFEPLRKASVVAGVFMFLSGNLCFRTCRISANISAWTLQEFSTHTHLHEGGLCTGTVANGEILGFPSQAHIPKLFFFVSISSLTISNSRVINAKLCGHCRALECRRWETHWNHVFPLLTLWPGEVSKIPSTSPKRLPPSIESPSLLNASLQTRFSTSRAKPLPYPISHQTLMDLMWESIITPVPFCGFALFFLSALSTVMDLQRMPPGPLKHPCLVCAAPAPGSSSAFSPVHRCQKTFS